MIRRDSSMNAASADPRRENELAQMRAQWEAEVEELAQMIGRLESEQESEQANFAAELERIKHLVDQSEKLREATFQAMDFASDMMQQLGWARGQSQQLSEGLDAHERDAYRLFDKCWAALEMYSPKRTKP